MAATCTVHDQCPDCGVVVPIACSALPAPADDGQLRLAVEADLTDVWAHAWTHEQ